MTDRQSHIKQHLYDLELKCTIKIVNNKHQLLDIITKKITLSQFTIGMHCMFYLSSRQKTTCICVKNLQFCSHAFLTIPNVILNSFSVMTSPDALLG